MRLWDILKLIGHEYQYEKHEWILSVLLQCLIYMSVIFCFTITGDIDHVIGDYIRPLYPEGFIFYLHGFQEADLSFLQNIGFHDTAIYNEGDGGIGILDDLHGIWLYKFQAVLSGKDMWSPDLDEVLSMILFSQFTFAAVGSVMFLIMLNNLSNSITMKLTRRGRYIDMLKQLGCPDSVCRSIYYYFFGFRNVFALTLASGGSSIVIEVLNEYIHKNLYVNESFSVVHWHLFVGLGIVSLFLMWISFQRQWRSIDERQG